MDKHLLLQQLLAYLDDELPETDRQAVESHLSQCSICEDGLKHLTRDLPKIHAALQESSAPSPWPLLEELLQRYASKLGSGSGTSSSEPDSA